MGKSSTSRNVLSGFLGWLVPLTCTFFFTPVILHGLGTEAYGLYTLVVSVIGYLASFNFNLGRGITRSISSAKALQRNEEIGEVLSAAFLLYAGIGLLICTGLLFAADWIVGPLLKIAPGFRLSARFSLYLGAAGLLFTLLSQLFAAVPQALQRFDLYSAVLITAGVLSIGGNGMMVWIGFDFPALIAWNVFVSMAACLAYAAITRRLLPAARPTFRIRGSVFGDLLRFGGAVTVYQVAGNALLLFERGWVTRMLGPSALSYFVIPMTIAAHLHAFVASLLQVIFPMASEAKALGDRERLYAIYTHALKYAAGLIGFASLVLFCGSRPLLTLWLGEPFADASGALLKIHAVTFSLIALMIVPWQLADGLGFPRWNAFIAIFWFTVDIPLVYWLTPKWGVQGVAAARLIAVLVSIPIYIPYVERRVFGCILWNFWGRVLALVGLAAGASVLVFDGILRAAPPGWIAIMGSTLVAAVFMGGILWGVGYLDCKEKEWLRRRFG